MAQPALAWPHDAPYTVDDLFELPDDGNRYEVLEGSLIVSPSPPPLHQAVADRLFRLLDDVVPDAIWVVRECAVGLEDGSGPVPDVVVTGAVPEEHRRWVPAGTTHTTVEVVSEGSAKIDRGVKHEIYAEAGIPCYWRVELKPWRDYLGPVPLIEVRVREAAGWRTVRAAAGAEVKLPVAIGRRADSSAQTVDVPLDPARLLERRIR